MRKQKMTTLDQLKQIADKRFDKIKYAVINNVYLDLQETYKLLNEMDSLNAMKHVPYWLSFYGDDFKIITIEEMSDEFGVMDIDLTFEVISYNLPEDKTIYKPTDFTKIWFSKKLGSNYPFKIE